MPTKELWVTHYFVSPFSKLIIQGFATARLLAKEDPGYHILMGSRDAARGEAAASTLQKEGLSVEAITIDVTDDVSIATAAELVTQKYGRLDVLINNAGIAIDGQFVPGSTSIRNILQKSYDINVFGAMETFHAFEPLLSVAVVPRVVFLSSTLSSFTLADNCAPGQYALYRSTKSALNMLVVAYAHTYKEKGWKINACCPGHVATNLNNFHAAGAPESGAMAPMRLATLGRDGETGTFTNSAGTVPW